MRSRSRHFSALGSLAAAALITVSNAAAEEANSLHSGATAIQFFVLGGVSQAPFQSRGLYVKHHLGRRDAIRVGADFWLDNSSGDSPSFAVPRTFDTGRRHSVTVTGEYERYVTADSPVAIYLALGPYYSRGRSYYERSIDWSAIDPNASSYSSDDTRSWELGAAAAAGFEWFFRSKLSMTGRLGVSAGAGKTHQRSEYRYEDGAGNARDDLSVLNRDRGTFGDTNAMLGVSVYF